MRPFEFQLNNEGFPLSRSSDLADAIDALHRALSKLDNRNLARFWQKGFGERLYDYARSEDLRNVVPEHILAGEVKI